MSAKDNKIRWSEGSLTVALKERYSAPEFAFLPQVRNCTGFGRRVRTADALAMSLYPSRGLHLHGFEIKTSRSDWVHEKNDPDKAEAICQYCDFWWLVVSDPEIVQPGELPPNWGLIHPRGSRLMAKKEPAQNPEAKPIDRMFLAGFLRKAAEVVVDKDGIAEARRLGIEEGIRVQKEVAYKEISRVKRDMLYLQQCVREFQEASGVTISSGYTPPGRIGNAVRAVLGGGAEAFRKDISNVEHTVLGLLRRIQEAKREIAKDSEICDWVI